jgi:hypothetical protein
VHVLAYCLGSRWQILYIAHRRRNRRRRSFSASASTFRLVWILILYIVVKRVRNRTARLWCAFCSKDGPEYYSAHTSPYLNYTEFLYILGYPRLFSECLVVSKFDGTWRIVGSRRLGRLNLCSYGFLFLISTWNLFQIAVRDSDVY